MPVNFPLHSEAQEDGQHAKPTERWPLSEREYNPNSEQNRPYSLPGSLKPVMNDEQYGK